jgi:uncharacterized protein
LAAFVVISRACGLLPGHWIEPSRAGRRHHQPDNDVAERAQEGGEHTMIMAAFARVVGTLLAGLIGLAVLVAAMTLLVRIVEPSFAFFPSAGEDVTPRDFGARFEARTLSTADGERLHAWFLPVDRPRAHIVYFHGNGGNLSVWAPILVGLLPHGYSVLAFDYRGYGLSTGRPSERGLYRDVDAVLDAAWRERDPQVPIVYWGRSLGTAMAAYAASLRPPDRVILESGFPDARTLVRSSPILAVLALFATYRFPTAAMMRGVRAPALVMHGDRDSVISFQLGRALFESLHEPKRFVTIRGGDHNDTAPPDEAAYWAAIGDFIAAGR